jgi:hypothetical protein
MNQSTQIIPADKQQAIGLRRKAAGFKLLNPLAFILMFFYIALLSGCWVGRDHHDRGGHDMEHHD